VTSSPCAVVRLGPSGFRPTLGPVFPDLEVSMGESGFFLREPPYAHPCYGYQWCCDCAVCQARSAASQALAAQPGSVRAFAQRHLIEKDWFPGTVKPDGSIVFHRRNQRFVLSTSATWDPRWEARARADLAETLKLARAA